MNGNIEGRIGLIGGMDGRFCHCSCQILFGLSSSFGFVVSNIKVVHDIHTKRSNNNDCLFKVNEKSCPFCLNCFFHFMRILMKWVKQECLLIASIPIGGKRKRDIVAIASISRAIALNMHGVL